MTGFSAVLGVKEVTDVAVVELITQLAQVLNLGSVGRPLELVATIMRYPALPLAPVQLKLGVVLTLVVPLAGVLSVGAGRFELPAVAKLKMFDQLP